MSFRDEESLNLKVRVDNDKDLLYCLNKNLFLAKIVKNFCSNGHKMAKIKCLLVLCWTGKIMTDNGIHFMEMETYY